MRVLLGELVHTHFSIKSQKLFTRAVILVCEIVSTPQKNGLDLVCIIGGGALWVDHICDFRLYFYPKITLLMVKLMVKMMVNFF